MADSMLNVVEFLKVFHGVEKDFEMSIPDTVEFDLAKSPATQMLDHLEQAPQARTKPWVSRFQVPPAP